MGSLPGRCEFLALSLQVRCCRSKLRPVAAQYSPCTCLTFSCFHIFVVPPTLLIVLVFASKKTLRYLRSTLRWASDADPFRM